MKIYENNGNFYARNNFAFFTPTNEKHTHAFLAYLSSSWFSLHLEKYGHIAGGGALQFLTTDYKNSPVPDFTKLSDVDIKKLNQAWKNYRDDFDVKELDNVVLEVLGFKLEEQDNITKELNDLILKRTG